MQFEIKISPQDVAPFIEEVAISLSSQYTEALLSGRKIVELRRRPISISEGGRVWIYTKTPRARIEAVGVVAKTIIARPSQIWLQYGTVSALKRSEFDAYFSGVEHGCAIVFKSVQSLENTISLDTARKRFESFHPPQFFKHLAENSPELSYFRSVQTLVRRRAA